MSKSVLLVGGNGYLGTHLKEVLLNDDEISITGTKPIDKKDYYQIDFADTQTFRSLRDKKFDLIIVLAASITGLGITDLNNADLNINTLQLGSFLQFVTDHNITNKLIFTSSMTVYAVNDRLPVYETDKLKPLSTYGLSKLIGENILSFLPIKSNIKTLILRLPGIYGGDRKNGFVFNTVSKALKGNPITLNTQNLGYWEAIEITDLCDLIHQLILKYDWSTDCEVINVGYGERTDFVDTARFIVKELNSKSEITVLGHYSDLFMSNEKLKSLIPIKNNFFGSLRKYIKYCQHALRSS